MIVFIGAEDKGYWVRETAEIRKEELRFVESNPTIKNQINEILNISANYLIFDIEQYMDPAPELADEIKRIKRAKNTTVIIYAPGYDRQSKIVQELMFQGIKFFVFSGNFSEAREQLERCLSGYYVEPKPEEIKEIDKQELKNGSVKIGVTGACNRIGTTTVAIQFVKYLQVKGHKACYIEVNSTGFVSQMEKTFNVTHDSFLGKVHFEGVDMYYKPENLLEVLKQEYDYFVYDFGTYRGTDFNKTSFLEKDVRIFAMGSKASEMPYTNEVIRNEYYTDVEYVFNFISELEKKELIEYMEEKAEHTHFTSYTPDPFEYVPNDMFEKILPVKDISIPTKPKKGWPFILKKKKGA